MKIYTKTGDGGTTSLAGGERVPKHALRIEAYGTVDELISWIGLLAALPEISASATFLVGIQSKLMHSAAVISAGKGARVEKMKAPVIADIEMLEKEIDTMESGMEPLNSFVLPGGSIAVANIHIARCVCRRAERAILRVSNEIIPDNEIVKYINRLSDYLFVLARKVATDTGRDQQKWIP